MKRSTKIDTTNLTADDLRESVGPIASLISKSQKAQAKLTPGLWKHTMFRDNLKALRVAYVLMTEAETTNRFTRDELEQSIRVISSMSSKVAKTQDKFQSGTSQHSLQRNRQKALRSAESLIESQLKLG